MFTFIVEMLVWYQVGHFERKHPMRRTMRIAADDENRAIICATWELLNEVDIWRENGHNIRIRKIGINPDNSVELDGVAEMV